MPISFSNIPANIKVPLYWVEVDPSMAGLPSINLRALMVGVMTADGDATPDVPIPIGSQAQADIHFGPGSELSRMFQAFYSNNFANEVWALPQKEPTGASPSTGTITITAPPTQAGTLHLYIAGTAVRVNTMTTDTIDDIANAIADAINNNYVDNGDPALPVTAVAAAGVVTLTSTFKSVNANDIYVSMNYYGSLGSEWTPIGLGITLPPGNPSGTPPIPVGFLAGGVGVPDFNNSIAAIQKQPFEYVAQPYTDSNSLFLWDQEYGFTDTGRWGWQRQQFGHVFCAKRGDYADLLTFGDTLNSGVESIMAFETTTPSPMFEACAAYAAKAQRALINDPARPLQTLSLNNIKACPIPDRFNFPELNSLASNGLAIQEVGSDNQPMILREQTTYQLNLYGQSDDAYELVTTLATLAKVLRNQKQAITSKFPRSKLADDGTKFGPGQAIVTPGIIKAELVNEYQIDMWNGLVENLRAFKANLIVERDPNNPNRVNVLYPPDLINQLRIFAVLAQFRLQYDRGIDLAIIGQAPPPYQASSGAPQ
jgi:phage tail sheath gpL-like